MCDCGTGHRHKQRRCTTPPRHNVDPFSRHGTFVDAHVERPRHFRLCRDTSRHIVIPSQSGRGGGRRGWACGADSANWRTGARRAAGGGRQRRGSWLPRHVTGGTGGWAGTGRSTARLLAPTQIGGRPHVCVQSLNVVGRTGGGTFEGCNGMDETAQKFALAHVGVVRVHVRNHSQRVTWRRQHCKTATGWLTQRTCVHKSTTVVVRVKINSRPLRHHHALSRQMPTPAANQN